MASSTPTGNSTSRSRSPRPVTSNLLEKLVFWHVIILVVGLAWSFGGQIPWARTALRLWGSVGITLFVFCVRAHGFRANPAVRELWPLLLFDLATVLSCLNPSFKLMLREGESFFALIAPPHAWLPSTARPDLTRLELWQLNGLVLSLYNLRLAMRSRHVIRTLLLAVVVNAVVLAIFGTLQKLVGAKGLWFGAIASPQIHFFSTFVYHNHWSAFMILNIGACLGLLFHHLRRSGHRDIWHSPALMLALGVLLLAASLPLSASRSGTALVSLLVFGSLVHFTLRLARRRRIHHESAALPIAALALTTLLAVGAIAHLGRKVIVQRLALTAEQVSQIRAEDQLDSRLMLYRDTWRMALEKPWFGWGLETYGDVFRIYNSSPTPIHGGWKAYYREAHNDWLQSLAESGFIGTSLLLLCGVLILRSVAWRKAGSLVAGYLLASSGLILLYAWVEFPFANPSVAVGFCLNFFAAVRYAEIDPELQA